MTTPVYVPVDRLLHLAAQRAMRADKCMLSASPSDVAHLNHEAQKYVAAAFDADFEQRKPKDLTEEVPEPNPRILFEIAGALIVIAMGLSFLAAVAQ